MNNTLIRKLAFRYLRGKRSANAVPILSRISMVAIAVSSAAMIIIFSVFNGLESIVKANYKAFYPDIRITAARGKFFPADNARLAAIKQLPGVQNISQVIEDQVFAINSDQQKVITLKGIDNNYFRVNNVLDYLVRGDSTVAIGTPPTDSTRSTPNTAILGRRIINELGADVNSLTYITLYYPNPNVTNPSADPMSALQSLDLHPSGVFSVEDEPDNKYVLASLPLVQQLFLANGKLSSIEISTDPDAVNSVQRRLQRLFGSGFKVETRYEQNKTMYLTMSMEKWVVYFILLLVLFIASFNMIGALSMLVLEKQKDIAILRAMGALPSAIKTIFMAEGILWSLVGGITGILLGCIICLLQQRFGFIKMGGRSFLMDAFPVEIHAQDIAIDLATIIAAGLLISWYPAIRATKAKDPALKSA